MVKRVITFIFILLFSLSASIAYAQFRNEDVALSVNPQYPNPNSNCTISLSSYFMDLNKSNISWFLDGNLSLEGIGKKNFSFTTKESGVGSTIQIKIEDTEGALIEKQIIITPTTVDLLWEAYDAYVPPFYKGKKIGTGESSYKVVAFPNFKSSTGLSYQWKLDGTVKQNSSGYEKNFYVFKKSYLDTKNTVSVAVSDLFSKNTSSGSITIGEGNPEIVFYKKDSALGVEWEKAINENINIDKSGMVLVAEPFFFSQKENSSNLSYSWYINDEKLEDQENSISIAPAEGTSGTSTIKLIVNNLKTLFQSSEKQLNVSF